MNPVVAAQLNKFRQSNPSADLKDSPLFEVFAIHSVLNGLRSESIDPFDAHLQGDEFGIDGIAILIQGTLCRNSDDVVTALAQGKNHEIEFSFFQSKTGDKIDYGDLSKFFDGTVDFFSDKYLNPTIQLSDLADATEIIYSEALKRNPKLRLFYVTTGKGELSDLNSKLVKDKVTALNELNIFESIIFTPVGAKVLQDGYRSATNSNSQEIEIIKPITLPEHPAVEQSFLGYVAGENLVRLATHASIDDQGRRINRAVFFDNVRDFNDKSDINKSILRELQDQGQESFVFKNNGVTIVAKQATRTQDKFRLEDYQIVNGCQTCNILFQAAEHLENVHVPVRLIISNDADFVSSIIVGTNKQNEVKEDQFWALKPFMKDLEEYSLQQPADRRLFIERREHQYRDEGVERTRIIKPSELVKAIAGMFIFQPHRAARDYRGIRKEFSAKIFQDDHSVVPYYAAAYASYRVDFLIRNSRVPRNWGIFKYYVLSRLGRQATMASDIFAMTNKKQGETCEKLILLLDDEEKLIEHFTATATLLETMINDASLDTRERIRDYIRSETVASDFLRQTLGS